jgi:iron complex outermembrane recepter protein
MKLIYTLAFIFSFAALFAQEAARDSSQLLQEVVIEAYETDRQLNEVPASTAVLKAGSFERFNNTSILPAVNLVPGVRMEERSPGSYRFAIRGSSLRSPFGVRNVKAYWNGLPFTDGGGNTYLNLLDFSAIGSLEIIKGPGGSLYGAGTGGVLLLRSPAVQENKIQVDAVAGSYGLQRYLVRGQAKSERLNANVQYAHHQSDGYREQTQLRRDAINADVKFLTARGSISGTLLYSDLSYGTPGGLTLAEFEKNPRQARPKTGSLGAVEAKAAVTNKTIYGGIMSDHDWNSQWTTSSGVYAGFSMFENPTIRNYEDRDETNFGIRTTTRYTFSRANDAVQRLTFGGEFQSFQSPIAVYDNDGAGNPGAIQVRDEVSSSLGLLFAQGDFQFPGEFFVTAGASINFYKYFFKRLEPAPVIEQTRDLETVFSPRLALLKKFSENFSLYASYSDGFSPPSLAEVRPSTNTFSNTLKAESGTNFEFGARGKLLMRKLSYHLIGYDFRLRNTIVLQHNQEGADYFINAGRTSQRGAEAYLSYDVYSGDQSTLSFFKVWASYAYQHYRFTEYAPVDTDYSGNSLTGVAPTIFSGGFDVAFKRKVTANMTVNYVDHIPLNDANTAFADSYVLVGLRAGWTTRIGYSSQFQLFAGVDNALDEIYSLGNDLNAFGGRFYNAAMPRNYYAGISISLASSR